MKKEHDIEKVYELIEQFDFEELSESERSFVMKYISEKEYNSMRSTIADTNALFSKYPVPGRKDRRFSLKRFLVYPIELYKTAAMIILIIGFGFIISKSLLLDEKEIIAKVDTIFVERIDTVVLEQTETIEVINTKIVYRDLLVDQNLINQSENSIVAQKHNRDCSIEICPEDMIALSRIKTKGNFSNDTSLTDFIVAMN